MRFGMFRVLAGIVAVAIAVPAFSAPRTHTVVFGVYKKVPYSKAGDPSGAQAGEESLKIRPLVVDGIVKEWTTGDIHDVTDRTFLIRRVVHLNDSLPTDKPSTQKEHWVWQRGTWLMVDRVTGHVTALKLPDYDPGVSEVSWFRDLAAYCGVTPTGKSVNAIVSQLSVRKMVLDKKIDGFELSTDPNAPPACGTPQWKREPLTVTFFPAGKAAATYQVAAGSFVLIEGNGSDDSEPAAGAGQQ